MARIDYSGLAQAIKTIIDADPNVRDYQATIEINPGTIALDKMSHIAIYERTHSKLSGQPIAAGKQMRKGLRWEIVVSALGRDFATASETRDELLGYVELALMANRTLGGALPSGSLELGGGELTGGPSDTGFVSQGSLIVTAEATATV
jgi:hypothetical protein